MASLSFVRLLVVFGAMGYLAHRYILSGGPLYAPASLSSYRSYSPEHYERVSVAMRLFDEERMRASPDLHVMRAYMANSVKHMYELKHRLPNDLVMESHLQKIIESSQGAMQQQLSMLS
jgi:hypothetical protein